MENTEVASLKASNSNLKIELEQAEKAIKLLQKENKNLLNQIESVNTDKLKQDVDFQNMKEKYEEYLSEKSKLEHDQELFREAQLEVESHLKSHREKYLNLQKELEATRNVEQDKINKLQQDNRLLRHKTEVAIQESKNTQKELLGKLTNIENLYF